MDKTTRAWAICIKNFFGCGRLSYFYFLGSPSWSFWIHLCALRLEPTWIKNTFAPVFRINSDILRKQALSIMLQEIQSEATLSFSASMAPLASTIETPILVYVSKQNLFAKFYFGSCSPTIQIKICLIPKVFLIVTFIHTSPWYILALSLTQTNL